jgi:hypothetical protein
MRFNKTVRQVTGIAAGDNQGDGFGELKAQSIPIVPNKKEDA